MTTGRAASLARTMSLAAAGALGASIALGACSGTEAEVLSPVGDGGLGLDDAALPGFDASAPGVDGGAEAGSRAAYCSGSGPPILVTAAEGGAITTCTGGLAQGAFRYALCTCEGYVSTEALTTDSFDSTTGAYDPAKARMGGSVGTNGGFNASGPLLVGGTLWGSDPTGLSMNAVSEAKGELHANGRVTSAMALTIGADAYVNGDLVATQSLSIAGTLHHPTGNVATAGGTRTVAKEVAGPVSVPPACDCAPSQLVDVAGLVQSYAASNDDAAAGIDPRALENVTKDLTLTIPCGRVYFTRVGGTAAIRLRIQGRTAVFVGGDLAPHGAFAIDVDPGSELDLFVGNNVVSGSTFALGSATNPASARLYVGGSGTLNLPDGATLGGNVYAPRAELVTAAAATVFGSVFARRVSAGGALTIHYDQAVLAKGAECPPPASSGCATCHDCGNQACTAGTCGACGSSADCCAPLSCLGGRCVADIR